MAVDPGFWYVRDNSAANANDTGANTITVGSVGWSALTAWAASASIAPGTIRRQSAGTAAFTASRSTTTLTVTAISAGTIYLGMSILTTGGASRCTVTALGTGTGGTGTYTVSVSGTVGSTTWNGQFVQNNQLAFIATQAATQNTGTTEPAWSAGAARGSTFTDGSVTWIECSGQPGVNGDITNTPASSTVRSTTTGRGSIIKDNAGTHLFIQTSAAGTTGSGEPTYTTAAVGNTTTDNTVTWTYIGTSFGSWAAPLSTVTQATTWIAAGDTIYIGDDHVEAYVINGTSISPPGTVGSPNFLYSIDHTASHPPTGVLAGAQVSAQGTLFLGGVAYVYGFNFKVGVGASTTINLAIQTSTWGKYDTCTFTVSTTGASSRIVVGNAGNGRIEFNNCTCTFGATGQSFEPDGGTVIWRNGTFITGGSTPTTLFFNQGQGAAIFEGCDLSAITGTLVPAGSGTSALQTYQFSDCRLGNGVTFAGTPSDRAGPFIDFVRCSSDSKTYIQRRYWYVGTLVEEATVVRTGGAADGATGVSWKITTTANVKWVNPFEAFASAIYNSTIGGNVGVTLYGIWNAAALPNNDDIWIDVEYLGSSGYPLGSYATASKSNALASNGALSADSVSAWDSVASARQNGHAYSLGDVIALASNPGRIFFCTTAGTTAGSEPGGYAGAVDGGSVTDNTAIFRAGVRFQLAVTLSTPQPQLTGYLTAIVKAAKATSTFYVDPLIVVS